MGVVAMGRGGVAIGCTKADVRRAGASGDTGGGGGGARGDARGGAAASRMSVDGDMGVAGKLSSMSHTGTPVVKLVG